jgi:uncharacterized RDD family membrane protein YckC
MGPPPAAAPPGWGAPPAGPGAAAPGPGPGPADLPAGSGAAALHPRAPLGARFVAAILDGLVGLVPLGVSGGATALAFAADSTALGVLFGLALAAAFGWAIYYSFTKDGRPGGQSIGKKAMGLMVVHLPTNQPCNRSQSAVRYLVLFGLNLIPYVGWLVEPVVTLAAAGGRRLGDSAAGTQVVAVGDYRPGR